MIVESKLIKESIPVTYCMSDDVQKKPLVILSHGFKGSKEQFYDGGQLAALADKGYCALAIDNRFHGSRPGPTFEKAIINDSGKADLLLLRKAMSDTADDIRIVIDEMLKEKYIDGNRVAMIGISMGGFITYKATTMDKRIKVCIPIISSPYWDDIPGEMPVISGNEEYKNEFNQFSNEFQPAGLITNFFPSALLMQVGEDDVHFNLDKVKNFHKKLTFYYKNNPKALKLMVYQNTGHEFKNEMWEEALNWLELYL